MKMIFILFISAMFFTSILSCNSDQENKNDPPNQTKLVIGAEEIKIIDRLLEVIEDEVVPITKEGTKNGSKVFGAAILKKSDLSLVLAASNNEIENPLWHGEVLYFPGYP